MSEVPEHVPAQIKPDLKQMCVKSLKYDLEGLISSSVKYTMCECCQHKYWFQIKTET